MLGGNYPSDLFCIPNDVRNLTLHSSARLYPDYLILRSFDRIPSPYLARGGLRAARGLRNLQPHNFHGYLDRRPPRHKNCARQRNRAAIEIDRGSYRALYSTELGNGLPLQNGVRYSAPAFALSGSSSKIPTIPTMEAWRRAIGVPVDLSCQSVGL